MYVYLYRGMSVSYSAASHASFNEEDKYDLSSKCISSLSDVKIPQVLVLILSNNQFKDFSTLPPNNELQVLQADNNKLEVINPEDFLSQVDNLEIVIDEIFSTLCSKTCFMIHRTSSLYFLMFF